MFIVSSHVYVRGYIYIYIYCLRGCGVRTSQEAQRKIEEAIRQKNVDENYETAMETPPGLGYARHVVHVHGVGSGARVEKTTI